MTGEHRVQSEGPSGADASKVVAWVRWRWTPIDKIEAQATALAERAREAENAAVRAAVSTEHAIERTVDRIRQLRGELRAMAANPGAPVSVAGPVDSRE